LQIINIDNLARATEIFKQIGVDPYGIAAMAPKAGHLNILLKKKSCKVANIIKQEMLSLGGDAAVARGSVSCSVAATDILIMGTIKQIAALSGKIEKQPFGLALISLNLRQLLDNLRINEYLWRTARREITLGRRTLIMGILNVTPDSFSDGGNYDKLKKAVEHGLIMEAQGADIIDVGGESTRPGAKSVTTKEELQRVVPVIERLAAKVKIPLSIDTAKSAVAQAAMAAGAEIINDVTALGGDKKMAKIARETKAALILMHMRGRPLTMQQGGLHYDDLLYEIMSYLQKSVDKALACSIDKNKLVVDPGIGFGKTAEDNYKILKNLAQLKTMGLPVLIGTSRKSFIGKITADEPQNRREGTAASVAAAIMNGCHIVRVHDVAQMKKVALVTDAIIHA